MFRYLFYEDRESSSTSNASSDTTTSPIRVRTWVTKSMDLLNRSLVEFTACMMFHFIGSVSPTPWANGIALIVLVYYTAKISGAHLNPSVTLAFCILGHIDPLELVVYWAAQVIGCIAGALWIAALVPGLYLRSYPSGQFHDLTGCFTPNHALTNFQVFAWEAVCTCCFIVPVFSVVWYTQNKKGYGNTGPLIVGLSLIANALACGQFTGASFNPARSVGSPAVFDCPYSKNTYVYVLGELVGGALATVAIIPWYGISRTAWYRHILPTWALSAAQKNHKSIILETILENEVLPSAKSSMFQRYSFDVLQPNRQVSCRHVSTNNPADDVSTPRSTGLPLYFGV